MFLLVRVGERLRRSSRVRIRQPTGRPYKHHDLGVAVDLTARNAVATVLGIRLSGRLAKLVGRTYHLRALPAGRLRVLSDGVNAATSGGQIVEIGLVE